MTNYYWIYGLLEHHHDPDQRRWIVIGTTLESASSADVVAEQVRAHYAAQTNDPLTRWIEEAVLAVPSGPIILDPVATVLHHLVAEEPTEHGIRANTALATQIALQVLTELEIPAAKRILAELRDDGISEAAMEQAREALVGVKSQYV